MKNYLKRTTTFFLALLMLVSVPLQAFAEVGERKINYDENPISDSGFKEGYINNKDIDVNVAKPTDGSKKFIEGPDIPDIYTMKAEYKIQRGDRRINNYQPYEASVGASIKEEDKEKIKQTINLPDFDGYTTPTPSFDVNYKSIVNKAKEGKEIAKKEGTKTWTEHKGVLPYVYNGKKNTLTVKHIFQSLEDKNKYGPMDGQTKEIETTETGLTGSIVTISPLEKEEIKGYEPETSVIETQMPENTEKYVVEYRYNRKHFDVRYDTKEGTPIPTRTIYYGQRVPSIPLLGKDGKPTTETTADPTYKLGSDFLGWKPSIDLKTQDGKEFTKDEIIKDGSGNPIKNLDAKFIMPADHVTFTAVWKDKEKADYAVQFWTEKADHADNASILDKYEYMSTRVYKDADTGSRPNLDNEPVKDLKFPDLNKTRLQKIWKGDKFNKGHDLFLNKFFIYNKELTDKENADPKQPAMTKSVSATGKTVYNIYYDRQVYDLYFTKSNAQPKENTIYPEIWKYDPAQGEAVMAGGPGNLYHYKARFNEMMYKWPNDAKQTKGFTPGYQSFGWGPNYTRPNWPVHLDTPPYRLNADQFLDMENYTNWGGYTKKIDKGDGTTMDLDPLDFKTLSFGIKQDNPSIPHHMDFWMDGFKKGETIIRYDLVRTKADTAGLTYGHKYPIVTGFTPKDLKPGVAWPTIEEGSEENGRVNEDDIDELNDERDGITLNTSGTYYNNNGIKLPIGQLDFIKHFFSDSDDFGDLKEGGQEFTENGYLQFHYKRNKYPLRFNYNPSKIKDDSEFNSTNQLQTFYEFPLKVLSPDLVDSNLDRDDKEYFKEDPKNLIDNPENLQKLGLTDLVYTDPTDNKLKVKRPDNLPAQMVFKGWALDPAGTKLVWENPKETMPFHPVNLYAKWAEPDFKWKVTLDPNGGSLSPIKAEDLTKTSKTIQEGDIGQEEKKTYPEKLENDGKKQIFTVIQRQQLKELKEPRRWGYDFLGWEWVKFNEDGTEDTSYSKEYKVPELYSFGNDIVSDVYLRAIWVKNDLQTVMAYHHILDRDLKEVAGSPESQELPKRRKGYFAAALGSKQGAEYTLVPKAQWEDLKQKNPTFASYYDKKTGRTNNYFQVHEIKGPLEAEDNGTKIEKNNPENDFHFFYMPYRKREYKVNYLDERCKKDVEEFIKNAKAKYKTDYDAIKNDSNKTEDQKREAYRALVKKNSEEFKKIVSKYSIIEAETVINGKRHYDARNYRHIPGWTLADKESPQQQLFFDVDENTNEFLGINGTGLGEIFFFYQDARVIEVKNPKDPVPDGYVRVTFKIDDKNKGGVFKDKDNNEVTELYYDVIKGLKSDSLPVPGELGTKADGSPNDKEERKYYITPDNGKNFLKWDNKPLLNKGTILQTADNDYYVFTAYFDWSGLTSSGLVRTEAFKDPNGTWTNDFAPTLDDLKKQLVWKENNEKKPIPSDVTITFVDGKGNELKTDDDVFNLVKEKKIDDSKETVRIEKIDAIATFKKDQAEVTKLKGELKALAEGLKTLEAADPQDKDAIAEQEKKIEDKKKELGQVLDVSITVYKNRYEALNKEWQKPKYLSDAEQKEAKDGGLKDLLKDTEAKAYVKVTVSPTGDMKAKDNKVYYVNPKAWVEIPEVSADGSSTFINWTADQVGQNDDGKEKGKFDFAKRHKFTEDTVITPVGAKDVVEQEKGKDKPDVPDSYVKVIVKTTDKATDETAFEKTFWVNPEKEVAITVDNPKGKENQEIELKDGNGKSLGKKKVNYNFNKWQIVKTGEDDTSLTDLQKPTDVNLDKQKYTSKVTVIEAAYKNEIQAEKSVEPLKTTKLDTPEGKEITDEILKGKITPQSGKEIESIEVISKPDGNTVGNEPAKVIVKYKDGSTQGTNDNPVVIPVEVHKNIIPETPDGKKPSDALENYVKVIFTAGEGGKLDKTLTGNFVYYVSPEVEVDLNATANDIGKIPATGYIANGGKWENKDKKELKGTFKDKETVFKYNFFKSKDIVEKTDQNPDKPEGYVTVKFIAGENGEVVGGNKTYFVNPDANIKLVDKDKATQGATNELVVPEAKASDNYGFTGWVEKIDYTNPIKGDREHVAKFTLGQVTLTYEAGEGAKGTAPTAVTVDHGTIIRLANADGLSKDNATFAGWKLDGDDTIYQPGAQIKLEKARTATAQWTTKEHNVSFDLAQGTIDGATNKDPVKVKHGEKVGVLTEPKREGYIFIGWKAGNDDFDPATTPVNGDVKLVAQWEKSVQSIDENTTVDNDKFIKVTFKQGAHGTLKGGEVTYKVAKDLTFEQAKEKGLKVPEINPANYYKVKDNNSGWNDELKFDASKTEYTFIAQYEPESDVIPIDPRVTPDDKIEEDRPEGMVLVEFVVDDNKAFMIAFNKFYVAKGKEVTITPPTVYNRPGQDVFDGWENITLTNEKLVSTFDQDTTIRALGAGLVEMEIHEPEAGFDFVDVKKESLKDGAVGYLEIIREGTKYVADPAQEYISTKKIGKFNVKQVRFGFKIPAEIGKLQSGDLIRHWSEKDNMKSNIKEITLK